MTVAASTPSELSATTDEDFTIFFDFDGAAAGFGGGGAFGAATDLPLRSGLAGGKGFGVGGGGGEWDAGGSGGGGVSSSNSIGGATQGSGGSPCAYRV